MGKGHCCGLLSSGWKPPLRDVEIEEAAGGGSGPRAGLLDRNLRFRLPPLRIPARWTAFGHLLHSLFFIVYWISRVAESIWAKSFWILSTDASGGWLEVSGSQGGGLVPQQVFPFRVSLQVRIVSFPVSSSWKNCRTLFFLGLCFLYFVQCERRVYEVYAIPGSAALLQCGIICAFDSGLFLIPKSGPVMDVMIRNCNLFPIFSVVFKKWILFLFVVRFYIFVLEGVPIFSPCWFFFIALWLLVCSTNYLE